MIKACLLITYKNLRKRKIRSISLILVYIVILAIAINIFSAKYGAREAYRKHLQTVYGEYSAIVFDTAPVSVDDAAVSKYGFYKIQDSFRIENYFNDIYIGSADETARELHSIRIINGKMPEASSEVVIEKWLAEKLSADIGDIIEINSENYNVTGILDNYSELQGSVTRNDISKTMLPAALVFDVANPISYHCSLLLKDDTNNEETLSRVADFLDSRLYKQNDFAENIETQSSFLLYRSTIDSIFYILIIAISGLILFLYYIIDIEFKSTIRIANALGAKRSLKLTAPFFYSFVIYFISIIPAVFLSFALSRFYVSIIVKKGIEYFNIDISAESIAVSLAVCFIILSVTAVFVYMIQGLSGLLRETARSRATINTHSAILLYSYKNLLMNLKRFYAVSIMLVICVVIVYVGKIVQKESAADQPAGYCDYEITRFASMAEGLFQVPVFQENMPSIDDFKTIIQNHNVQQAVYVNGAEIKILVSADTDHAEKDLFESIYSDSKLRSSYEAEQNQIKEEKKKYRYEDDDTLYFSRMLGVEKDILQQLKSFRTIGEYDPERLLQGRNVIICVPEQEYKEIYGSLVGKQITLSHIRYHDFANGDLERNRIDYTVVLDAIILLPEKNQIFQEALGSYYSFVTSNAAMEQMNMDVYFKSCFLQLYHQYATGNLEEQINLLSRKYQDLIHVNSYVEMNTAQYMTSLLVDTTVYCIIVLLVFFAAFILFINYIMNMDSKKDVIRRLYVIGTSKKELNIMLLTEYLNYIIFAFILSVPIVGMLAVMAVTINAGRDGIGFTASELGIECVMILLVCILIAGFIYFANKVWLNKILSDDGRF